VSKVLLTTINILCGKRAKKLDNRKTELEEKRFDNDLKKLKMELEHKERVLKMELKMKNKS